MGCFNGTMAMNFEFLQVSYTVSSSAFANTVRYPRFFRLLPIAEEFANGFVAVVKKLNWNRVAVISYLDEFVSKVFA